MISTYNVSGMTSDDCASRVLGAIARIPDVTDIVVNVKDGTVVVTSDRELKTGEVQAALREAGFDLEANP